MDTVATCARHPRVETRLSCSECATAICPRCAVEAVVGQKCPDCARRPRSARPAGRPRQWTKAGLYGAASAAGLGLVLPFVWQVGFFTLIISGVAGYGVGRAVRAGAEGNGLPPFRNLALGLAIAMVVVATMVAFGTPLPGGRGYFLLAYPAAAYGAYLVYR